MSLSTLRLALVAGVVAPFALASASFAEPAPPPSGPPPAAGEHHRPDPAQMRAHMAEHLRDALQLRPDQQGALDAFLDAMKPSGGREDVHREHEDDQALTTPQRLDQMLANMDERRVRFAQMAAAMKQFYAALSPSQQKALDAMHAGGMHGDHDGMMGGERGHDRDRDGDREGPHEMGPDGPPHG